MRVNLLFDGYKNNEEIFNDFKDGSISADKEYFSEEYILIDEAPNFPIYMGNHVKGDKKELYKEAIQTLIDYYIPLDRSIHMNETFWHSLLLLDKRDYIVDHYPQSLESYADFKRIVLRKFDWENYIYKCVLAAEYISDSEDVTSQEDIDYRVNLIAENLDLYNYILKYNLFRNSDFISKFFTVVDNEDLSKDLKAKIPTKYSEGKDRRYIRVVFEELNNSYPVLNSPALSVEELKNEIYEIMGKYS